MKRFTLFLAIVLCLGVSLKAQTHVGDLNIRLDGVIPGYFTSTGHPYVCAVYYDDNYNQHLTIYQSDFITPVTDIMTDDSFFDNAIEPDYYDLDVFTDDWELPLTQTLFNDDEHFEFIEREREYYTYYDTVYWYDEEQDTVYWYVETYQYSTTKAINIKSTNGNTIWSFTPGENRNCGLEGIVKFDNKFYMMIWEEDLVWNNEDYYSAIHLYLIKQNQGVAKVESPLPMSVFPTLLNRDQQVTVELGEGNNAREITVVNNMGQVVKRIPVENGQRTVTFPANDLRGLNVLSTRTSKGRGSCKIIVR